MLNPMEIKEILIISLKKIENIMNDIMMYNFELLDNN